MHQNGGTDQAHMTAANFPFPIDEDFFDAELIGAEAAAENRARFQQFFTQHEQQQQEGGGDEADEQRRQQREQRFQRRPVFINSLSVDRKPGEGHPIEQDGQEEAAVRGGGMRFGDSGGNFRGGAYNFPLLAQSSSGFRDAAAEENATLTAENQLLYGEIGQLAQDISRYQDKSLELECRLAVLQARKEKLLTDHNQQGKKGDADETKEGQVQMETTDDE